jgi:hypothetical protein
MIGPILPSTDPLALAKVTSDNKQIKRVPNGVDVFAFELDPGGGPLCRLVGRVKLFDYNTLFVVVNGLIEFLKDFIDSSAFFASHNLKSVGHFFHYAKEHGLSVLEPRTHKVYLLTILAMGFDVENIEDFVTNLQMIIRLITSILLLGSHGYLFVKTKWRYLFLLVVPDDHLSV